MWGNHPSFEKVQTCQGRAEEACSSNRLAGGDETQFQPGQSPCYVRKQYALPPAPHKLPEPFFPSNANAYDDDFYGPAAFLKDKQKDLWKPVPIPIEESEGTGSSSSSRFTSSHSQDDGRMVSPGVLASEYAEYCKPTEDAVVNSDLVNIQEQMYQAMINQVGVAEHCGDAHQFVQSNMVMIQNLPYRCTKSEVSAAMHSLGFSGSCVFFCLPLRRNGKQNYGFACVSFVDHDWMMAFCNAMDGYRFTSRNSMKVMSVVPASMKDALLSFLARRQSEASLRDHDGRYTSVRSSLLST
eukprot:TRINITY_DN59901_c0_g2_i1.p1 TRINITY_DN59901_c0_g2~~TRINITY_DN59901_c0_g2_i1.p1  ORF type:complete len:297 (+),score=43.64 TRINITY_DN59901_c0_g2_i1:203-1093(+)